MMTETNPTAERYQVANDAAGEAIDALMTVYWADSFDLNLLQNRLAETIAFTIRNARKLSESHPTYTDEEESTAIAPHQQDQGEPSAASLDASSQPFIDLRACPSPDILRVLAIGSPQVVSNFVLTLFQLGYARPEEWSRQLPTINPGEVMQILTKRVISEQG